MTPLAETASRQACWSATANALKSNLDRARWSTFVLSILGALLATIASQLDEPQPRLYVAIVGAVVLATMSFLSARLLSGIQLTNWVRARSASEALKRAAYSYAAGVAPYSDPATRDSALNKERNRIEQDVDDLVGHQIVTSNLGSCPRTELQREEYLKARVRNQVDKFYLLKAETYRKISGRFRTTEFLLSLLATVITAVVGVAGKEVLGFKFDLVSLTAVLTTIGGAILAHIEASRLDFLVMTYRAAARRLTNELAETNDVNALSAESWSAFVNRCEAIMSEENSNWIAKWSKPDLPGRPRG